jgi:hypothetical protein
LGPPDNIIHDVGKNFASIKFRQYTKSIAIQVQEIPIEAYNSIRKVERYYTFLQQVYEIIYNEFRDTNTKMNLQIVIKAINDSARPDGIIPIFLIFSTYPRITENLVLSLTITKRAKTIHKTTKEVRRLYARRQVTDTLAIQNGPNIVITLELLIQLDVQVWRETDGWNGPFKLLVTESETCLIVILYSPTRFRTTVVKLYYQE